MNARRTTLHITLLAILLGLLSQACMDGQYSLHQGGPGYPCEAHEACTSPLLCLNVPDVTFPVCTGSALEGEACSADTACAWLRDPRGLPLTCLDATCQYPPDGEAQ